MKKLFLLMLMILVSGCAGLQQAEHTKAQFHTYTTTTPDAADKLLFSDEDSGHAIHTTTVETLPISTATQTALDAKQAADDDLTDLADGSLTGTKLGPCANTTGALPTTNGVTDGYIPKKQSDGSVAWMANSVGIGGTPYRIFYTNAIGNVIELELGADGTYLRFNGPEAAPSCTTPSGAGDILSVLDDSTGEVPEFIQAATVFSANDVTPSIADHSFFITANTSATTITNFDGAADGKVFWLLVNDGYTTFDFTSSGLVGTTDDYLAAEGELVCFYYSSTTAKWHFLGFPKTFSLDLGEFATDRAVYTDSNGILEASDVTKTELELLDGALNVQFKSIDVADLNDTATPSVLTTAETVNTCISNYKSSGADHVFTMCAAHGSGNIIFQIGDEYQVDIEPNTDDLFYLNGTAMAVNEHIQNTADTLGQRIVGYCVNINGTLRWMFYSSDAAWVQETP